MCIMLGLHEGMSWLAIHEAGYILYIYIIYINICNIPSMSAHGGSQSEDFGISESMGDRP